MCSQRGRKADGLLSPRYSPTSPASALVPSTEFYTKLLFSAFLVVIGGVFSGLTLGLMGEPRPCQSSAATRD